MSKMQDIIDKIELANKVGASREAIEGIVEALKLLAKGQQQIMRDIENVEPGPQRVGYP